jgi:hypothetical protein
MQWVVQRCSIPLGIGFASLVTALSAGPMGQGGNAQDFAMWATVAGWVSGIWFAWAGRRREPPAA